MKTRKLSLLAGFTVASLALVGIAACSPTQESGSDPQGVRDSLVIAQSADIASLSMNIAPQRTASRVAGEITESAVKIAFEGDSTVLVPGLAESWKQIDDHTWRFQVRPGVTFTNGEKLTAETFKSTLDQYREDPAGKITLVFTNIEIEVVDPMTFDVITDEPNLGSLPAQLTSLAILPTEYRGSMTEANFGDAPIGTGPYMMDSWQKGISINLVANPDYWGGVPAIKEISVLIIPDAATRVGMLETGDADLIADVPPELSSRIESLPGKVVARANSDSRSMLVLNSNTAPTDDIRVRQAINYAVDREGLVESLFGGYATPIFGTMLEGELGYLSEFTGYPYSPEKAKSLLAEAGYPNGGVEIDLNYTIGSSLQDQKVAEALQSMLEEVGFKVNMKGGAFATLMPTWRKPGASSGIYATNTSVLYPDISFIFNKAYFHPESVYGSIWTKEIPELTAVSDQALTTAEPAERQALYEQAQQIVMDEAVWAPMFNFKNVYGMDAELQWSPVPDNRFYFENASFK